MDLENDMDLEKIIEEAKKRIELFLETLGMDGKTFTSVNPDLQVLFKNLGQTPGEFYGPDDRGLSFALEGNGFSKEEKNSAMENGVIFINDPSKNNYKMDFDFYTTIVHEMFHAYRNLLVQDYFVNEENEKAFITNNGKFEPNTLDMDWKNVDPSQDILKGHIDNSRKAFNQQVKVVSEEDEGFDDFFVGEKMTDQQVIDESLVEIMAIVSCGLNSLKEKKEKNENVDEKDIWDLIERIKKVFKGFDIEIMCEIIQKHQDFELFKWMVDPIEYSSGDIHYDYFNEYTKNDGDLLAELYTRGREELQIEKVLAKKNLKKSFAENVDKSVEEKEDDSSVPDWFSEIAAFKMFAHFPEAIQEIQDGIEDIKLATEEKPKQKDEKNLNKEDNNKEDNDKEDGER